MDYLPQIFYITGIAYFTIWILIMIFIGVLAWKAYQYFIHLPQEIQDRLEDKVRALIPHNKTEVAGIMGSIVVPVAVTLLKNMFGKKERS